MKVIPVTHPADIKQAPATDVKAKAVQAFNDSMAKQLAQANPTAQEHPVQDPNNVSVEELSAIQSQSSDKETTSVEEVVETTQELPKKQEDPALSRQFAQLARQERQLRQKAQQQEQAIKAREEALKVREAELTAKDNQYKTGYFSVDRFKADPLGVMAETGLSYEELTQQILNQHPSDPRMQSKIDKLEAKIKEMEEATQNNQKSYEESQRQAYQSAVKQIEMDAKALVKNDPNYETILATGSVGDVVELITETYNKDGVLLTVEEAAQEVENYLVDEALKVTRISKIKRRLEESNASAKKGTQQTQAKEKQTQPQMKTLTNATSSTRQLSAKERAILAFKGELKS